MEVIGTIVPKPCVTGMVIPEPRITGRIGRATAAGLEIEVKNITTVIKELYGTSYPVHFTTSSSKLRNYIFYGNSTGDYDPETGKYKLPVIVRKRNMFDASHPNVVLLYPDTDGVCKASGTSSYTKQRSFVCEVEPDTVYTVYVNYESTSVTARVAGYIDSPVAGDTALWTDRALDRLRPPINTFTTTAQTHYVMVYFSYGRDDVNEITPTIRLIKGTEDFTNTVTFMLESPLAIGQALRYDETGIEIPTAAGDCELFFGVSPPPYDIYIQYDSTEVNLS